VQETEIVDHRERHREGTDPVFFPEGIDRAFHPHPAVVLGERGGRKPHQPHPAVRGGGGESHRIEKGPAADRQKVRMAVEVGGIDEFPGFTHP
jgi:hypothetical protein